MICALDGSSMLTVLRRLCGQSSTGPSAVFDQSMSRMRAPMSPPPWRNAESDPRLEERSVMLGLCRGSHWLGTTTSLVPPWSAGPHAPRNGVREADGGGDRSLSQADLLPYQMPTVVNCDCSPESAAASYAGIGQATASQKRTAAPSLAQQTRCLCQEPQSMSKKRLSAV